MAEGRHGANPLSLCVAVITTILYGNNGLWVQYSVTGKRAADGRSWSRSDESGVGGSVKPHG